jgi:hypothetical protein
MTEQEKLEKRVADTRAAYALATDPTAAYSYAWDAYTGTYAYAACVDAEAAYLKAMDELKEYKEQDNQ